MARSVASIAVSVIARTGKFVKGMKRAVRALSKFTAGVRRMAMQVAKFGLGLAAVATGAMALFIKQSFSTLDALAKASDRLGITADTLRGFERAVELTGGTIEGFRKNIIMMVKNIGDVAGGTGEAKDALEELRLDAQKLMTLAPDEMMLRISKAMQRIPTQTRRLSLAAEVFGTRGVKELLNFLNIAPARVREMIKESVRLSGSLSRLDLAGIERANDAFADMQRSLRAIIDRVAIELAPVVEKLATRLTEVFVNFRSTLVTDILPSIGDFVTKALNFANLMFADMKAGVLRLTSDILNSIIDIRKALANVPGFFGTGPGKRAYVRAADVAMFATGAERQRDALASGNAALWGNQLRAAIDGVVDAAQSALAQAAADRFKAFFEPLTAFMRAPLQNFQRFLTAPFEFMRGEFKARTAAPSMATAGLARARAPTRFAEIDLSRTFVQGLRGERNRKQLVKDPDVVRELQGLRAETRSRQAYALVGP